MLFQKTSKGELSLKKFKVQDFIEVCGDMYIVISDFNKVNSDDSEFIYWQGWTDDYFKERPFGEYEVKHISFYGTKEKEINYPYDTEKMDFNTLYILIEKEN